MLNTRGNNITRDSYSVCSFMTTISAYFMLQILKDVNLRQKTKTLNVRSNATLLQSIDLLRHLHIDMATFAYGIQAYACLNTVRLSVTFSINSIIFWFLAYSFIQRLYDIFVYKLFFFRIRDLHVSCLKFARTLSAFIVTSDQTIVVVISTCFKLLTNE